MKEEEIQELFRHHQGGRFEIRKILGIGGMGVVVQAFDKKLKVLRAIKIFNPELLANESLVRRFENEASIMAGIEHPNIVKVYDIGEIQSHHFIVLEWIDGGSLGNLICKDNQDGTQTLSPMHPRVALLMIYYVCDALSVAHKRGIIHRDIKPDNILITNDGMPKVADFGIAHMDGDDKNPLTGVGEGLATPRIGAPEQFANAASVDARADVYATAVTFWMLMTAMRPPGLLFLHDMEQDPELLAKIPVCLHRILKKAVAYYPAGRYASMEEFAQALRNVEDQFPPLGEDVSVSSGEEQQVSVWGLTQVGATRIGSKPAISLVIDPTTISKRPLPLEADVPREPVEESVIEPTRFSKPTPIPDRDGNTLAYRPSGEVIQEIPLQVDSDRSADGDPPPHTPPAPNHRSLLIGASVFCVVGLVTAFIASSRPTKTTVQQPVVIEQKQRVVEEPDSKQGSVDVLVAPNDISIASDVSTSDVEVKLEPDIPTVVVQVPVEHPVEKQQEKKDRKAEKSSRSIEVKAGETLVLKPVEKHEVPKPPILESPQPKLETVKVQVGLKFPSDDAVRVWLVGPGGKHKLPGSVAPGTYKVVAIFKDQDTETVIFPKYEVLEGTTPRLSCDSAREVCQKL